MRFFLIALCIFSMPSCARFNKPLTGSDRVLVASSAGNFVKVFGVNATTGGLTLQTTLTITAATLVAAHPTSGAFLAYKNNATLECYQYDFRRGTGPTFGSSTAVTNVEAMAISPDGASLIYTRGGSAFVYWRSISDCTLGTENQTAATSFSSGKQIFIPSDSTFVVVTDGTGNGLWRFSRNTATGALTQTTVNLLATVGNLGGITPNGRFLVIGGSAITYDATTLAVITDLAAFSMHSAAVISNTRAVYMRSGVTHAGLTLTTSGVLTQGASVVNTPTDFGGGIAVSPTGAFFYTGSQGDNAVFAHKVRDANPFCDPPTLVDVVAAPDAIAYLPGYSG